ncbi:MAG: right-handed parallel beta-helix repeat-containing protein, partial [Planctomycetes bacterium]|nr:right-handed parallel beta-helix repeat-containing protein [Planctomycetota bacterium]
KLGRLEHGFTYEGDRPRRWKSHEGLWVHGYWAWDWANTYEEVASIDLERRLVRTAPPHGIYGFRPGQRFYFTNVLEELDQPGEYFADPRRGVLYFLPPSPPAEGDAFVSVLEGPLVSIEGVSHVALRDLVLELGRGSGVRISGGERCLVAGCTLRSLGNHAVLVDGGRGHAVEGCEVHDAGDGGVTLRGGDRAALEPAGHRASGNHVHHVARWSRCYVPAFLVEGVGSTVSGNLVHDHPHCAILYGGNDHTIELNEIHRVCLETGDVGAIYTGRDWTARGTAIRHNFIHHTGGVGMGSMGVYLDDCASGQTVTGNVFWRVQRAAFIGGGRDNAVENNVFVDCDPAVWVDGRGLDPSPVWRDMVAVTMKERLERVKAFEPPYAERYPELKSLIPHYEKGAGVPPEGNRIARNVCSSGPWLKVFWHAKEDMLELRDNLVEQDPGFADAAAGDFRLRDGSPAFAIGFKPIPADRIGRLDPDHGAGPCAAAGPVVEVEEEVARCAPPGNGAGPLWCYGAPLIARRGDEVFASAMETGEGVPLLCNTRPRIFRKRGDGAWELLWRPEGFREREPCPLAALEEALILSVSSSKEPPGTKYGAADPHLLAFHAPGSPGGSGGPAGSGLAAPEPLRPPWPAEATFTDHSYRGLAVDAARGEVLALNIDARSSEQRWSFRDAPGAWSSSGAIRFPIRSCYPQVALRDRAAHVLAIGDIVEPVEEWKRYKSETTGSAWDYVFRRLFYSWARDIGREGFSEPLEVETADATAGHISNLDLWIDAAGAAHLLYTRRNVSSPLLRDRFFPGTPIATALVHVVVVDGRIARRETLLEGGEGRGGAVPGHARLHAAGDGRLFAVFFVSGSDGGRPVSEDRLIEVLPERGRAVRIPLRQPFTSFFTACERGGSAPSRVLDLFGIAGDGQVLRYARVRLPER